MQKKTISIVLCLAMLLSMFALTVPVNAATVESEAAGVSKIESASDFTWDNANVYFLLTDRFYNGDTSNDHSYGRTLDASGQPISGWNTSPATFHGGDFKGLTMKINEGYFDKLGVNAIWISAPYEQIHGYVTPGGNNDWAHYSYHGYYVLDYTETDANFGTKAEFKTLVDTAHSHGIRIVMDVVMNHAGYNTVRDMTDYGFNAFKSESAAQSYLYRLTNVNGMHDEVIDYEGHQAQWANWWGNDWIRAGLPGYTEGSGDDLTRCLTGLPDFRTESTNSVSIPPILKTKWSKEGTYNQKVAKYGNSGTVSDYLTTWLAEWVETYGVDGFRCDTAKHVEFASWNKLKTKCSAALKKWRQNNPTAVGADWDEDFWMTGECWDYKPSKSGYFTDGGFDSMINFAFSGSAIPGGASLNGTYQFYADSINSDPNYNLLTYNSSHDSDLARGNLYSQGTTLLLMPGGVQPFYGDETNRSTVPGLSGDTHGGSGHSLRSDMNWSSIDQGVLTHWQKVGTFRKNHVAIGAGQHRQITAYNASTGYTFERTYDDGNVTDGVICCVDAPANTSIAVNVSSLFGNGKTVTNEYDGTTAVVQNGKATFNSGAHGVILISGPQSTINMSLKGKSAFYDSETVTLSLRGADYAMVSVNGGTAFRAVDGQTFTIGEDIGVGETFDVVLTATNDVETAEKSYTFKKKDPDAVTRIYFDNSAYNWQKVNAYIYDDSSTPVAENAAWPGKAMELDSDTGYYVYEVEDEFVDCGAVVFNNGGAQYPPEGVRLDIGSVDMILYNGTQWEVFGDQKPTDPPAPGTQRTIYLDNSSMGCSNPCIYVWKNNTTECAVAWPGTSMTAAPEMGSNIYKYTCDAKYDCCIFLDGGAKKTDDIKGIPYLSAMYSGSWSEVKQDTPTEPTQPTQPQTQPTQPQTQPTEPTEPSGGTGLVGDADLNGRVSIKDVTAIQRHLAQIDFLTGNALKTADADQGGNVTIKDATYIQAYLAERSSGYARCGETIYFGGTTPTQPQTQPTQPQTQPTQPQTQPTQPQTQPTQPAGTRTIYLDNSKFGASDPHVYVWKQGTTESVSAWPGSAMTNEGNNIYSFTCAVEYNCCIFSRDGGSNSKISGDLENIPYTAAIYDGAWKEYSGSNPVEPTSPTNPDTSNSVTLNASDCNTGTEEWYAWTWNDTTDGVWVKGEGQPSAVVFSGVKSNIIFTRMNPACNGNPDWGYVWNKTSDLSTQLGKTYKASDWLRGGSWQ